MAEQNARNEIARRFENESNSAQQIVNTRSKHWRYLLAVDLLRSKLAPIGKTFDDLKKDRTFKRSSQIREKEVIRWLICKIQDLRNLIPQLQSLVCDDLIASVNDTGKSGNPVGILEAVEKICEGGRQLLIWEEEMCFTLLPDRIEPIRKTLRGTTGQAFDELNRLADKLEAPFKKKNLTGKYTVKIVFKDPPNMRKLSKQLSELLSDVEKNPQNWIGWS